MAHIVFLTLYLGLVTGKQPIEVQADPGVVAMKFVIDGQPVVSLTAPPWRAIIDFGKALRPQELVAVGFDKEGNELGRASQSINLPRPVAEASIVLEHDAAGAPSAAEVRWRNLTHEEPRKVTLKLDDRALALAHNRATLPRLDLATPHVLSAEVQFSNGVARPEMVFGGTLPDSTGSELTATLVRETGKVPASLDGCFLVNGNAIRAQAIEKTPAFVVVVRDPSPYVGTPALIPTTARRSLTDQSVMRRIAPLEADTRLRILWPVADRLPAADQPTSVLFRFTGDFDPLAGGMLWHLISSHEVKGDRSKRQFADAAAVAGVQAMTGARRRAVVLVLATEVDASRYDPANVRHYLASIGVPLFIWSLQGLQPEITQAWGSDVVDVTNQEKLRNATGALNKELGKQRIVWLDTDPIHALRATVNPSCGLEIVAR
jgi:hypothetical protein